MRATTTALPALLLLLLTGCGEEQPGPAYLSGQVPEPDSVLECASGVADRGRGGELFDDREAEASPLAAVTGYAADLDPTWPRAGWEQMLRYDDEALLTLTHDGEVRMAVLVAYGETASGEGWHPRSWARCDVAELPSSVADRLGVEVWTRRDGSPVPVTELASSPGAEHCGWQDSTVLTHGEDTYWSRPAASGLADRFEEEYVGSLPLPDDAVATPYQRDGARLWFSRDRSRAYVGTPDDVALWPREAEPVGCA